MDTKKKEYQVIDLFFEYGTNPGGCKYAIASGLKENVLKVRYKSELERYEPYIYLTQQQGDAIVEGSNNEAKHRMRTIRSADAFGYEDGVTERFHTNAATRCLEDDYIDALDQMEFFKVYDHLNETQKNRVWMYVMEGRSQTEIAEIEGVSIAAVHYSIKAGLKKLKKILEST